MIAILYISEMTMRTQGSSVPTWTPSLSKSLLLIMIAVTSSYITTVLVVREFHGKPTEIVAPVPRDLRNIKVGIQTRPTTIISSVPRDLYDTKVEIQEKATSINAPGRDSKNTKVGIQEHPASIAPVQRGLKNTKVEIQEKATSINAPGRDSKNTKVGIQENPTSIPRGLKNTKLEIQEKPTTTIAPVLRDANSTKVGIQEKPTANIAKIPRANTTADRISVKDARKSLTTSLKQPYYQLHTISKWLKQAPKWLTTGFAVQLNETDRPIRVAVNKDKLLTSRACRVSFEAHIRNPKPVYNICDTIEVIITARDCQNRTLKSGGDFLWTWIETRSLKASQTQEGNITDVGNGTYIARFKLRWTGDVKPMIAVVRTREEVEYLRQWREKVPARFCYQGTFKFKNATEFVPCHITPWMNLGHTRVKARVKDKQTRHVCNFTDPSTGSPWFCFKPLNMPCSAFQSCRGDSDREKLYLKKYVELPRMLKFVKNIKPENVIKVVAANITKTFSSCECNITVCNSTAPQQNYLSDTAYGVYYNDIWTSLKCSNSAFDRIGIIQKLRNKSVHLFGDSTIRQWFEYLEEILGSEHNETQITQFHESNLIKLRYYAQKNITLTFKFHSFPIRGRYYESLDCDYVANKLDALEIGGPDVIIAITIWAHFTESTLDFYRQRLSGIRDAIIRLLTRLPGTKMFIKSANTRAKRSLSASNWFAFECDQIMRAMLGNIPGVTIIDAWEMTIGHHSGFFVHPVKAVVKSEVDMMLSYL